MNTPSQSCLIAIVSSIVYLLLAASTASGSYVAYLCQLPNGRALSTSGWSAPSPHPGVYYDLSCADGSGLQVRLPQDRVYPRGFRTGLEYKLPVSLRAVDVRAKVAATSTGNDTIWSMLVGFSALIADDPFWRGLNVCYGIVPLCWGGSEYHSIYRMASYGPPLQGVGLFVQCDENRQDCAVGSTASIAASSIELTLQDTLAPQFLAAPRGTLTDSPSAGSVKDLHYAVQDRGGGLKTARLLIDGSAVATASLGTTAQPCQPPFATITPCPSQRSGTFQIETSRLLPGAHVARVEISDVSGNTSRYDVPFDVPEVPPTPGSTITCAADSTFGAAVRPTVVGYGRRARVRFSAVGLDAPPPSLLVLLGRSAPRFRATAARIASHYVATVPTGRSRIIRLAVPSMVQLGVYRCSRPLPLRVRAGIRLRIKPRALTNGETFRLRGRLMGGREASQRSVVIEARAVGGPRQWTPVRVLKTNRQGRFAMRYTFRRTYQRVRFVFRARVRPERGFPYAASTSPQKKILVRG